MRAKNVFGHAVTRIAAGDWRCSCGEVLGKSRTEARAAANLHRFALAQRTLPELMEEAWRKKIRPRVAETSRGCWEYEGPIWGTGYGCVWVDKPRQVHRVAAALFLGLELEDSETYVCHRCDNPPCCNPSHLFLGTASDNMQDAESKGRAASGSLPQQFCRNGHDMSATRKTKRNGATYCGECHKEYMRAYKDRVREAS